MEVYDYVLAGGGLAGLSLAYQLVNSPLRDRSILIVDPEHKTRNDRTWCFWTDRPTPFDAIVYRSWDQFKFVGEDYDQILPLGEYRYKLIRGIDFYRHVTEELESTGRVQFRQGRVDRIRYNQNHATVSVEGEEYESGWVFDSRFQLGRFEPSPSRYHLLKQHFVGWSVETLDDAFDPLTPYFMDLRTPQKGELRFFYVLPYDPRHALVEFVTSSPDQHREALEDYLTTALGIENYTAVPVEGGLNPLTDFPFPRRAGERVLNIGTRGGRVKPTTGYAFLRIQQDSAAIVRSLVREGHPFDLPADSRRYRLFDSLWLDVIQRNGHRTKALLTALFKNNPVERVLSFLDETASPAENSLLIASLPPQLFLQSLFRLQFLHRI